MEQLETSPLLSVHALKLDLFTPGRYLMYPRLHSVILNVKKSRALHKRTLLIPFFCHQDDLNLAPSHFPGAAKRQ